MSRRRGRRFGEIAHVARVYVGERTAGGKQIPKKALTRLMGRVAGVAGGATMFKARGIYRSEAQPFVDEPSTVIETFVSAGERSCSKFKRQMKAIGSRAASEGLQESVGVVVECAGEPVDAVFASARRRKKAR